MTELATLERRLADAAEAEDLLDVAYTTEDTPLGPLLLAATGQGLLRLAYLGSGPSGEHTLEEILVTLAARVSPRVLRAPARLDAPRRELEQYFAGQRTRFDLALDRRLMTPFAARVLSATAEIPYGACTHYGAVAAAAGSPHGARAAGNALGSNPLPIVIPCHRVRHAGGGEGGYTGGLERKRRLLALEAAGRPE
jgi:methylated-DNA-[protein]-cysteine S-methyltransferase